MHSADHSCDTPQKYTNRQMALDCIGSSSLHNIGLVLYTTIATTVMNNK